jgi:hypothetical protein
MIHLSFLFVSQITLSRYDKTDNSNVVDGDFFLDFDLKLSQAKKMETLPDELILLIAKKLDNLLDVANFKRVNKLYNSLINIDDYISEQELSQHFVELKFDNSILNSKNFSELIIEDVYEQIMNTYSNKNIIKIYKDKITFEYYSFSDLTTPKYTQTMKNNRTNFRIFVDMFNTNFLRIIYLINDDEFIKIGYYNNYSYVDIFKFDEKITKIFDQSNDYGLEYYLFTRNNLKIISYDNNNRYLIIDYLFIRQINPNLYIYRQIDSDDKQFNLTDSYIIVARYKDLHMKIIYKNGDSLRSHTTFDIEEDYAPIKFDFYVKRNKELINLIILENVDNKEFEDQCRNFTKFNYQDY